MMRSSRDSDSRGGHSTTERSNSTAGTGLGASKLRSPPGTGTKSATLLSWSLASLQYTLTDAGGSIYSGNNNNMTGHKSSDTVHPDQLDTPGQRTLTPPKRRPGESPRGLGFSPKSNINMKPANSGSSAPSSATSPASPMHQPSPFQHVMDLSSALKSASRAISAEEMLEEEATLVLGPNNEDSPDSARCPKEAAKDADESETGISEETLKKAPQSKP